jgi:DNA-binding transcriptional LysR family regulator
VQNLLALVAAGVGVARLAVSSRSLRRGGAVFVPLRDDWPDTVVLWPPGAEPPVHEHLRAVVRGVAHDLDPAEAG